MNKLAYISILPVFCLCFASDATGQDSELAIPLPPMPMLDLGDPDTPLTWSERRRKSMIAKREEARLEAIARSESRAVTPSLGDRIKSASQSNSFGPRIKKKPSEPVVNSISSSNDALTASGNRLVPFGEEGDYWAGMPTDMGDQLDISLPPMPDLRTPDQVVGKERFRNRRVAKQEMRKAQSEAQREEAARKRAATVSRPQADPSTALVIVESGQPSSSPGYGNIQAPETINEGTLKPFNSNSVYIKDNQQVYRGDEKKGNGLFGLFGRKSAE